MCARTSPAKHGLHVARRENKPSFTVSAKSPAPYPAKIAAFGLEDMAAQAVSVCSHSQMGAEVYWPARSRAVVSLSSTHVCAPRLAGAEDCSSRESSFAFETLRLFAEPRALDAP